MKPKLLATLVLVAPLPLAGCFQIEGVHRINSYGNADEGTYSIVVAADVQAERVADGLWGTWVKYAQGMSKPRVTSADGFVTLADMTGGAVMEAVYDTFECNPTADGSAFYDCHFAIVEEDLDDSDWSFDWTVYLRPEFEVLASNAGKESVEGGLTVLSWEFHGGADTRIDVDFTVRAPIRAEGLPEAG